MTLNKGGKSLATNTLYLYWKKVVGYEQSGSGIVPYNKKPPLNVGEVY